MLGMEFERDVDTMIDRLQRFLGAYTHIAALVEIPKGELLC